MLKGHLNYFAVSGNHPSLWWFFNKVRWLWLVSLRRRSQKARLSWEKFIRLVTRFFPPIRTLHPLPCHRFDAKTRGRRSYAGTAGGVIPVRCYPHHQGIGEPDDGPFSKQPTRRNAW